MRGVYGSFLLENSLENNRIPLLYVDVNLGANRTERIVVFEGDESEELAERFIQEHGTVFFLVILFICWLNFFWNKILMNLISFL